jgi:arsenate reductase (glutaredoxin)
MLRVYSYKNCSTCRDALKWLAKHSIACEVVEIRETPPTGAELAFAYQQHGGDIKKLLNTSGQDYREMGLKSRLETLTEDDIFALIKKHGNLCKRPFLIDLEAEISLTGFHQDQWHKKLLG